MKIIKLICIVVISLNLSAKAVIRNVPSQYSTIQSAINACSNGDTVLVQPGTYMENLNFRGKNIVLTSRYYQNNDYSFIQNTIINGSNPTSPDSASCVIISHGEDSSAVLQGFTITGGSGTKWQDEHGAGLYREGGGILIQYSYPVIQHNIITSNQAIPGGVISTGGGGMRIGDSYPKVFNNLIINNTGRYGAGVVLNYTGGEYKNNVICRNYGSQDYGAGSGFWVNGSYSRAITILNNTVVSNSALSGTPGIYSFGGAAATVRNNIVWGNTSTSGIQITGSGSLVVRYCDVQGGYNGAGNINSNPLFDSTNYYIASNSPCIDTGDSSLVYNDPPDPNNPNFAKWPARGGLRNDMGAYGGPGSNVIANTIVAIKGYGEKLQPDNFYLSQNYPNPFNPKTIINYQLSMFSDVKIRVYDILGNEVETLVNQKQNAGSYEVEFDGSDLSSGIYFYKLDTENYSDTKRMILLK